MKSETERERKMEATPQPGVDVIKKKAQNF